MCIHMSDIMRTRVCVEQYIDDIYIYIYVYINACLSAYCISQLDNLWPIKVYICQLLSCQSAFASPCHGHVSRSVSRSIWHQSWYVWLCRCQCVSQPIGPPITWSICLIVDYISALWQIDLLLKWTKTTTTMVSCQQLLLKWYSSTLREFTKSSSRIRLANLSFERPAFIND